MLEEHDFSTITGLDGYDSIYSLSEFTDYLKADLSTEESKHGRVFWTAGRYQQSEYGLYHYENSGSYHSSTEIRNRIISVLKHIATFPDWLGQYLVQFWAPKVDGQHHYLATSDQPFSLNNLCEGLCWYRKQCMDHCYYVGDTAKEEQLGAVGRVYRNKHPESSPDLRLYSTNEFPLRDCAARCGLRNYLAVPVFDLHKNECYGVLEVLSFGFAIREAQFVSFDRGLQAAQLRSTHTGFVYISLQDNESMPLKYTKQPKSEISKMLELAIQAVPQLHLAQVWVPCKQCADMSCMERTTFVTSEEKSVNSCQNIEYLDVFHYLQACEFHNLQIKEGMVSCFHRNLCDISISENPLAHYAQKARLSLHFALSLESVHNGNDLYVVEFFLQSNSREDASVGSFLQLLLRIIETELKSFKFELGGQVAEELILELSQPYATEYQPTELNLLMLTEQYRESYSEWNFQKYLQTADLCCLRPLGKRQHGWVFCSSAGEELSENDVSSNPSPVPNPIKEKIKLLMNRTASDLLDDSYSLVQFWAPKMDEERCYLATSDQPYALGCLHRGLALFRKQCMRHHYFVDERAKEEELGPPGRVFRNGHPEITSDLRQYSTREFPLRNCAAHCGLRKYFALPLFNLHQHNCVGVLEFVEFCESTLEDIGKALEATDLSSPHINFKPSFIASRVPANIAKCRKLALTEVKEALQLVFKIPQIYLAEVWVPYGECASINSNLCCMELAMPKGTRWEFDFQTRQIHVEPGKGIVGMVLASENKSCFCRNSCDFSITEQPLAHHDQREKLDICFAICLQSSHTGNLPYVFEFFLNQGPATYEYLRSFLNFLLPIMKQKLKSFKVASGKQLGDELVVEVIQFSEANRLTSSELDQPYIFPLNFRIVHYGQKEQQHTEDQHVEYVSNSMDSVTSVAQAQKCSTAADNSNKKDVAKKIEKGKGKISLKLSLEDLKPHFGKRLKDVAEELGVGRSTIKRACREHGICRWPCNEKQKNNPSLFELETAYRSARDCLQNMRSGKVLLDTPHPQNLPQTKAASTQHLTVHPKAVTIKAKYEDDTVKFQFCVSSGLDKLLEEVAMRLDLELGSFKLKYVDEDNDEILLGCDTDLKLCLKSLTTVGNTCIQLSVQLIRK